jgi:hypothetical protein
VTNDKNERDATIGRLLATTPARDPSDATDACLDADTLAAWADNALDGGELAVAAAHAADCARCQAMLAAMVRTAPPMGAAAASWWRVPFLRWLVPLTAAAATVLVWIAVPVRDRGPVQVREVSQEAESIPAPTPAAAAPAVVDQLSSRAASSPTPAKEGLRDETNVEGNKKAITSADANAVAGAAAGSADTRLEKVQQPAEPPNPMSAAAAPASPALLRAQAAPGAEAKTFAFDAPEHIIVSSNPASRWRIVPGGGVQRSADGGATWQTESTGVSETLTAGSSPSPSVCWLVGPNGIVLLSTDGRSWTRLTFPESTPLASVRATDELTATVTTADGRQFVTEDGGKTWARAPGV